MTRIAGPWLFSLVLLPPLACCGERESSPWGLDGGPMVVERLQITDDGGRVSWCHAADVIAFDREIDDEQMEVFAIDPDGSDERCITCDAPDIPLGWRGQPEWHPSCEYLMVVVPGQPFIDDGFSAHVDGSAITPITDFPGSWEEHTEPSPGGTLVTFNSSRATDWEHPPDVALTLSMEIWAKTAGGEVVQLTRYNDETPLATRAVTSDYAWGPNGRHIVAYRGEVGLGSVSQYVEVLELDGDY